MSSSSSSQVWLVIDSQTFGGIETHVLELAKGLKQFEIEVKVWLLRHYSHPAQLAQQLKQANIAVDYLDQDGDNYFLSLLSKVKHHRPVALHAHGYKASVTCKAIRLLTGINQVSTYHAGETPKGKVWLYDAIDRYSGFVSSHSIVVSDAIAAKLPYSSVYFNNFVDSTILQASSGEQIAFVGRLSEEKAPDRFVELARLNKSLNFDVYGSGAMEARLKSTAPDNVVFHGHQTDMAQVWDNIGLLIICSRYEGLPMAALEAMARGIPVLALNVGNLSKLIQHQSNGYLVDSMAQLNQSLSEFINLDNNARKILKSNAITTIEQHFSPSAVIPQLLAIYSPNQCQTDCQIEK
ncbi:glycosyltransferase family 4 protein [Vibrio brasiliensis]|jgi:glycosyltransferase involved in cell wall biosynthesis|uniref:glycosyltransferase family 4 protein n=1 Tax=Vibrio brasiliensis TaxID=170652 RepID=UPI001EFDC275|nr:glycosyltransferase family 4 protein [Vibrio brasiliensis]MCG9751316.1 glycosyltransferase family 4 protein [Vibrio brasiliensis]MCG9783130.1 glycosyltransferase family 4 protein [Vibrio brasiliensis]